MDPNTFFHGKINIYLSKAPEDRDLIQSAKKSRIERIGTGMQFTEYEMLFITARGPITMPNRVLIQFAHPALQKSRVNRRLIAAVQNLENVTINDLYEEYPGFLRERAARTGVAARATTSSSSSILFTGTAALPY